MTKDDFIAELRGISTGGSAFANDPEIWGEIISASISAKERSRSQQQAMERRPEPSDNGNDDGA